MNKLRVMVFLLAASGMVLPLFAQASVLTSVFCSIISTVRTVIGILALALFLLGGVLYAVSHFLPTTLDVKKSMASWSTAMIVGGVIGLIIVVIAPFIVNIIAGIGSGLTATC